MTKAVASAQDRMSGPEWLTVLVVWAGALLLIPFQQKLAGYLLMTVALVLIWFCRQRLAIHLSLIGVSVLILSLTPINTDISLAHMSTMGAALIAAVALPYIVSRYIFNDNAIRFPFHHGRRWYRREILYIAVTAAVSYLILPFYLQDTGSYLNWTVEPGTDNIFRFFIGTNALGIWDELFFVSTVLGLLRHHMAFWQANLLQAILFTGFLYELGFRGWAPLLILPFTLLQGYIFKQTDSLLYVITIHLTLDLVLFFALLDAHHPDWVPVFITG